MAGSSGLENGNTLVLERRPASRFKAVDATRKNVRLISLEEHTVTPFNPKSSTSTTFETSNREFVAGLKQRLGDIALRMQIMDANNIGAQFVSLNQPTAQAFVA